MVDLAVHSIYLVMIVKRLYLINQKLIINSTEKMQDGMMGEGNTEN